MAIQTVFVVPALMDGDRVLVPQVWLGRDVQYRTNEGVTLSAVDHQRFYPPALAELRHAFFYAIDGSVITWEQRNGIYVPTRNDYVSPEYRQLVRSKRGYGEWTSTFLIDGKEAIVRPEEVSYNDGSLVIEGKATKVELPPPGWALEHDKPTGFPSRTSKNKKDAERVFGDDASYFYYIAEGLRVVSVGYSDGVDGPFCIYAHSVPDDRGSAFGSRSCYREMDALGAFSQEEGTRRITIPLAMDLYSADVREPMHSSPPPAAPAYDTVHDNSLTEELPGLPKEGLLEFRQEPQNAKRQVPPVEAADLPYTNEPYIRRIFNGITKWLKR